MKTDIYNALKILDSPIPENGIGIFDKSENDGRGPLYYRIIIVKVGE
jgi:hypothetical protein